MSQRVSVEDAASVFARRDAGGRALGDQAEEVARACHDMAVRFHGGATLIVFGNGGSTTDAQHISVEFVHPVIVGKRALPATSLTNDVATVTGVAKTRGFAEVFAHQLRHLGRSEDIALGVSSDGRCENVLRGLRAAKEMGMLTIALTGGTEDGPVATDLAVDHVLRAPSDDPLVVKEAHVTAYHVLWELVHVFFEQPGVLEPGVLR